MEVQRVVTVLLSLIFLIAHHSSSSAQQVPLNSSIERSALLDLRSSLSIRAKDWPKKAEPCSSWVGVECRNGRVTGINVSGFSRTRVGRLNPRFAVDALANLTNLASFNSSGFALPGSIPDWFGTSLRALQVLDLRSCSVSGSIPFSLGDLNTLKKLYLSDNMLTGAIPSSLGQLMGLSALDLSNNLITGTVPAAISNLSNLTRLDLSSNYLSGSIPPGIGNLSRIQFLNLSSNSFTSVIPVQLGGLSQLIELDLSLNSLTGPLPVDLKGLRSLQKMVLSGNRFDGALPDALLSMPNLRFLDVSVNNFTGTLPNLSLMVNAADSLFNLSNNLFYGFLNSSLRESGVIDLSNNYLQGKVPNDAESNVNISRNCLQSVLLNQRSSADCTRFYEERGLTFDNFGLQSPSESPLPQSASKNNRRLIYILGGVLGGLGFVVLLVVLLLWIIRTCEKGDTNQRGSANVGPVPEEGNPPLPKDYMNLSGLGESYTYAQMLQYTGDFSETNLIKHGHSGDLFHGTLEGGAPVVIRRVDLHSFKKEAYTMELELFNKILHTRLVPLLGHCLEHEHEKFLVYKYMPNGDLSKSLYRPNNSEDDSIQSLDWITRLKIAIGTAEVLSYLHHECSPPLVHRDIQSSSILLDDKYEVRLGSLSEVRAQEGDGNQNVITRLLRRTQNSEQCPSGSSSANCTYDVYCFGKVLLELVTGKLGISKSDDATVREWLEHTLSCISIHDKEIVAKIIDPSLIIDEDLLEEVWAMAIVARSCLNPKPSKRPPMRYIFKALENPLKVVREEHSSSARFRTTSSRRSWSAAVFGSWRQSSSESASAACQTNREGINRLKQSGRIGSQSSGGNELSSSRKRLSSEIFPEPVELQDVERQDV